MNTEQRARFEAYAQIHGQCIIKDESEYLDDGTEFAWKCWQNRESNREPFVVKLPCVIEIKDTKYPYDQPVKYYLADKITEAITAAGGRCV